MPGRWEFPLLRHLTSICFAHWKRWIFQYLVQLLEDKLRCFEAAARKLQCAECSALSRPQRKMPVGNCQELMPSLVTRWLWRAICLEFGNCFFRFGFWAFVLDFCLPSSLLLCFSASLLFAFMFSAFMFLCFSTFLLLCFSPSPLFFFSPSLLLRFSASPLFCFSTFCFSAFPCFSASSPLEPKPTLKHVNQP